MAEKINPTWFKDVITYALPIHSFYDSSGNGTGDIPGLIQKLDYLEDLGINCISLLPFYRSPLKDDGYDVSDFKSVHPDYGTLEDFKTLISETHKRGIKVMIDIIMNHTSTEHEWFQRARKAPPHSEERSYYIWSDTPEKYPEADILFSDYENSNWKWDNVAKSYYWHRFYSHQADLNYNNAHVRKEIQNTLDFWYDLGVDGLRLTSVMFIFQEEGTNCENLPAVHEYLKSLRKYVDQKHPGKVLVAETNLWPEEAAEYFGEGDECHMNYHFPLMPRLYMALQTEDRYPIIDILEQTPSIPESCQWALFLRNHDDLMLSMVTEEERDYLYKVFAQDHGAKINDGIRRRLAPLLSNDRRKIELLNSLLFSLPGSPVVYYGDEIGMGDNIYLGDRNGIRTPMQWNSDRNAGFSNANPQKLFLPVISDPLYRYEAINVELQSRNSTSLLWWMKNIIAMRKRLKAFSHGKIEFLDSRNGKVLSFIRSFEGESILVVANLSKFSQAVELNLKRFKGIRPIEIFSQNKFFAVSEAPYQFTLSPYGYHWFLMEGSDEQESTPQERLIPEISSEVEWDHLLENYTTKRKLEKKILPFYLRSCRWFGGKSKKMVSIDISHSPSINTAEQNAYFLNISIRYTDGLPETYFLPVSFVTDPQAMVRFLKDETQSVLCYLQTPEQEGIIIDAIYEEKFRNELFWKIKTNEEVSVMGGLLNFEAGKILHELDFEKEDISSEVLRAEQSNTSVIYNDQFFFKIYRKLDTDINPDLELVRFLSEKTDFQNSPRYGGGIQFFDTKEKSSTILGLLQNKIPNQGEAWTMMLEALSRFYEKVLTKQKQQGMELPPLVEKPRMYFEDTPEVVRKLIGSVTYERVVLLGQRTAEMHVALASDQDSADFCPERFSQHYQRSVYSQHRKLANEKINALSNRLSSLPEHIAREAQKIVDLKAPILDYFSKIYDDKIDASKTRVHGDYHLGQVLYNGKDFLHHRF
jgi:maltose alpha-D-glucosyltransferase/alpha-amylase